MYDGSGDGQQCPDTNVGGTQPNSAGPLTISQLATGPATTQLVSGLETAGYVTRERSPDDKLTVLVALTDAGAERSKEHNAAMATALDEELSDQDLTALHTATKVLNRLCAIYDRL